MQKNEFVKRFQLNTLGPSFHRFEYPAPVKPAAVLIPLIEVDNELTVLLTKRAAHLAHHPGQISFPGGKVEATDIDHIAAALREAEEEIGLSHKNVTILGQLQPYQTISGYVVTPIIGFIEKTERYTADANEVAEIFQVPFQHFLHPKNHHSVETFYRGKSHKVYFMPYKHYNIWGATAAMIADLVHHIRSSC